jgi:hypothetical protein
VRIHYFKRIKSLLSNGYRLFRILLEVSISAFSLDPKAAIVPTTTLATETEDEIPDPLTGAENRWSSPIQTR